MNNNRPTKCGYTLKACLCCNSFSLKNVVQPEVKGASHKDKVHVISSHFVCMKKI